MIKYVLLVQFIFVVVSADITFTKEEIAKLQAIHDDCMKESGVDKALLQNAMKGEYADDAKLKEHILCANKKLEFQNDNGDIREDVMVKKLSEHFHHEEIVKAAVAQCAQKKDTPQDTALALTECLHKLTPENLDVSKYIV